MRNIVPNRAKTPQSVSAMPQSIFDKCNPRQRMRIGVERLWPIAVERAQSAAGFLLFVGHSHILLGC